MNSSSDSSTKKPIPLEDCAHARMSCMFGRGLSPACLFLLREN